MEQEDAIEYGQEVGVDGAVKILADWLCEDRDWLAHILDVRLKYSTCSCRYDEELGNDYCDYWRSKLRLTEAEANMTKAQEEFAEELRRAQKAHHDKIVELTRQGLMP